MIRKCAGIISMTMEVAIEIVGSKKRRRRRSWSCLPACPAAVVTIVSYRVPRAGGVPAVSVSSRHDCAFVPLTPPHTVGASAKCAYLTSADLAAVLNQTNDTSSATTTTLPSNNSVLCRYPSIGLRTEAAISALVLALQQTISLLPSRPFVIPHPPSQVLPHANLS